MEHRVHVRYTEPMLRQAVRLFVWRGALRPLGWLWFCAVAILAVALAGGWLSETPVVEGACIAALIAVPAFFIAVWRAHFRNTIGTFRAMTSPEAEIVFGEADVTITSSLGASTLSWQRFVKVWEAPGFWMLFLSPSQFITVPLDSLSPEVRGFVRSKLP